MSILDALDAELAGRELARRHILDLTALFTPNYLAGWFHHKLAALLDQFVEDVLAKRSPRLVISCPPRHGKSRLSSVSLPPYLLGRMPEAQVIAATYGQTLSDDFGRTVRDLLNDPLYTDLFPDTRVDKRTNSANTVRTTSHGMYFATSIGGALTGLGAHALIIDDPVKSRAEAESALERKRAWDWFTSDARTRLLPGGGIIVTATRWHPDDLTGRIIEQGGEPYIVCSFPAIAEEDEEFRKAGEALHPERYPISELDAIRRTLPARDWMSLYQCKPFLEGGDFFKTEMFQFYDGPPPEGLSWYAGADYAVSESTRADHTAIVLVGIDAEYNLYVHPNIYYDRATPDTTTRSTISMMRSVQARTLGTEKGVIDKALGPEFRRAMQESQWYITFSKTARTTSKVIHAAALQARMAQRKVFFPRSKFVEDTLVPQYLGFSPEADNRADDLVDALVNAVIMLDEMVLPELARGEEPVDDSDEQQWNDILNAAGRRKAPAPFARLNGDAY